MSQDGYDWTEVKDYPRCQHQSGTSLAFMSAPFTQEALTGACPLGGAMLVLGRSCHCGFGVHKDCPFQQTLDLASAIPAAPTTS